MTMNIDDSFGSEMMLLPAGRRCRSAATLCLEKHQREPGAKKVYLTIFAVLMIPFVLIIAGKLRFSYIRGQVEKAAKEANPSLTYEVSSVPDSKDDFIQAIYNLADWEQDTRQALNDAFGMDGYMLD